MSAGDGGRPVVLAAAVAFALSSLFPALAGLARATPRWLGIADVAVAAVAIVLALSVVALAPGPFDAVVTAASFRAYRAGASLFLALLVTFFLLGDRVRWSILLVGLAWRGWLLAYVLPAALSVWRSPPSVEGA